MRRLFTLLAIPFTLWACKKTGSDVVVCPVEAAQEITLALHNCNDSDSTQKSSGVCFTELVEDSRCPANAVCVWAGVAIAKFSVNLSSAQYNFSLSTIKSPSFPPMDTVIAGYHFTLVDVLPYPGSGAPGPVRAVLRISR